MTQDDLKRRIKVLEASRSAVEERRRFAHTRRKLTLDGLEVDQAREEERAARVELERIQLEISALQANIGSQAVFRSRRANSSSCSSSMASSGCRRTKAERSAASFSHVAAISRSWSFCGPARVVFASARHSSAWWRYSDAFFTMLV